MVNRLPIAVLISGGGTTLRNLLEKIEAGELPAEIRLVISSNPAAAGLQFANKANIPSLVVEKTKSLSPEAFSAAVFGPCREAGAAYVVMGGYLKHVLIPPDFENRVVNIHPALLPAFCGQGMYGLKVHQAVLDYGAKITGCTVHFVDNEYDHGPIILQRAVEVRDDDTAETLQARVFTAECQAFPDALRLLAYGSVSVRGRHVSVKLHVDS
jgi:phosphoribosylglycinamide formyltransferase 1